MIAVTGATGNVGRSVADALRALGAPTRALIRAPEQAPDLDAARLDLTDRATFAPALAGCRALFLVRPPAIGDMRRTLLPLLDDARGAGVRHAVFVSVLGAERKGWVPHAKVEAHLKGPWRASGGRFTILRPGFFMQNLGDTYRRDIVEDDRIHVPTRGGRVAWIDARDIGEAAARALIAPDEWVDRCLPLTGPVAMDFAETARIVGEVVGRPVRYDPASGLGFARHLRRRGHGLMATAVLTILHLGLRRGDAEAVDPTLGQMLGRPPRALRDYLRDHRSLFEAD